MSGRSLDKFYTLKSVAEFCIDKVEKSFDAIIEPSAGSGSFSDLINCLAYDIKPENKKIIKLDFLQETIDIKKYKNVLCIGNPPFGKQCSLAVSFFNRCASYKNVNCIAFILPKSFRKDSVKDRCNLSFHLDKEYILNEKSFTLDDKPYSVPTVFQIWKRSDIKRVKSEMPILCDDVSFIKNTEDETNVMAVRRVGYYAGKAYEFNNQSNQSHYFLKTDNFLYLIEEINKIKWEHNDTSGPRSISKRQLIPIINEIFNNVIFIHNS